MINIGIIGANGQVGSEVSLLLSKMENVRVIPICRTEFGAAFLKRYGIECRIGSISKEEEAKSLLKDCALIADFTYLKGLPSEIKSKSKTIITNAIINSPPNCKFVFASSMMAFGMGKHNVEFKNYLFARSVYGAMKRYSEKISCRLGEKFKKEVYILRIGQVHGELQSVTRKMLHEIKDETTFIPDSSSYTVFAYTIAEALVSIAMGKEKPGLYTLVSKPEWSWEEVHKHYCKKLGINPEIILTKTNKLTFLDNLARNIKKSFSKFGSYYAEVIASYFLIHFPKLEQRLMALYYIQKAKAQIYESKNAHIYSPYGDIHTGRILGKRLVSLSDSRKSMIELTFFTLC